MSYYTFREDTLSKHVGKDNKDFILAFVRVVNATLAAGSMFSSLHVEGAQDAVRILDDQMLDTLTELRQIRNPLAVVCSVMDRLGHSMITADDYNGLSASLNTQSAILAVGCYLSRAIIEDYDECPLCRVGWEEHEKREDD